MQAHMAFEELIKRDRRIVLASLAGITGLSWAYVVHLASSAMQPMGMSGVAMPKMTAWSGVDFVFVFVMWVAMMVAMMIPSAAPLILTFSQVRRKRRETESPFGPTGLFVLGYFAVWTAYSLLATVAQWGLHTSALLSSMMGHVGPMVGGVILLAAGVYQLTPLKRTCLHHCRTPMSFLLSDWREGGWGTFVMGLEHGTYCAGCCWALMAILFVAGVMNVLWIALIAGFVLVEKVLPAGDWIGRAAGAVLGGWGAWLIVSALLAAI